MTTTTDSELRRFQKLADLLKKTPGWNEKPDHAKIVDDLCVNTSKEAQDVRDILWRMVGAELNSNKRLKQNS